MKNFTTSRCLCGSWLKPLLFSFVILFFLMVFSGCSSAPRQTGDIFVERNMALNHLNLANQTANQGRYEDALVILEEARRLAISTDDPSLRVRTTTSRGIFLFYLGRHDEAFVEWENASTEGDASGEPALAALARIYSIRARIILLANETRGTDTVIEELKTRLNREMTIVRADSVSTAAGHITLGLAERQLGRWTEAEREIRRALDIHERNNSLEDAAYCWFLIASIRSLAGNHNASLEALRTAINFDRRAENGFGLASSWQAMGDVYQNAGRLEESRTAWRRAAEIYRAIGLIEQAENLEGQL
jgi:tetratricopeptide (TPR) repeat protein